MTNPKGGRMIADIGDTPSEPTSTGGSFVPAELPLRVLLGAVIIVFAGAAAFSATLAVPFHFEDRLLISENESAHRIATVQDAFGRGDAGPVVWLSHAINWSLAPDSTASFHAVNLALHLINALLIFFICRVFVRPGEKDALPWVPLAAGLLFALHPLATESVNYVVGRSSILAVTFSLGAILAFLQMSAVEGRQRNVYLFVTLACAVLALGSHRAAWLLPLLLLVADWCRSGTEVRRRLPIHGLVLAATLGVVVAATLGGVRAADNDGVSPMRLDPPLSPQVAIARGADLTINRRPLSAVQSAAEDSTVVTFGGNAVENFAPTNVVPGIALVSLAVIGGVAGLWFRQLVGFGLAWYAGALLFGATWARDGLPFSERAVYFPLVGLAIAAAGGLSFIGGRQRVRVAAAGCVAILLAICAIATFTRSQEWMDEQTIWELARENAARSPVPYHRLAVMYGQRGEDALAEARMFMGAGESVGMAAAQQSARDAFAKAAEYAGSAVAYGADDRPIRVLLGRALHMSGANEEGETVLRDVLRANPADRDAIVALAALYETRFNTSGDRHDIDRAADLYERAIALGPLTYEEWTRYGRSLLMIGDLSSAQAAYARASQMAPGGPVDASLQELTTRIQQIDGLERRAAQVGAANMSDPNGPMAFAFAASERNDLMVVLYTLEDLLELHPEYAPAWVTLGLTQARMGQSDSFLERYGTAPPPIEIPPPPPSADGTPVEPVTPPPPWIELAKMCVRYNLWDDAAKYLMHAGEDSGDERLPMLLMADLAREQQNSEMYVRFVSRATEVHPNDPQAWLLLCDIAIQTKQTAVAVDALTNARERGAAKDAVAERQQGIDALTEQGVGVPDTVS